jgi:uncharacterized phage protein gp47/JayE
MSFTPRTRETIRADFLAALSTRYTSEGRTLDVSDRSDAYKRADALAVILATIEQQAAQQVLDTFVDTASNAALERHAAVYAMTRRAASPATLTVDVTGTPSTSPSISAGSKLSDASGALYTCSDSSVVLDGSGDGQVEVVADDPGAAGTLAVGTVLTWVSTPAGLDPTGEVFATVTAGEDAEDYDDLRARLLARLRQRPASGNSEDWRGWCEDCDGVTRAYVYPLLGPGSVSGDTLGCVTVVVMGPAQGDSATNTSIVSSGRCAEIEDYIEGIRDAAGALTSEGTQLRPAAMAGADYEVTFAGVTPTDIEAEIKTTSRYPFSFTGTLTVDVGPSTATSLVVSGDETAKTGKRALVRVSNTLHRGGWQATELKSGSYNGGTGKTTFTVSLSGAPNTTTAYPAPANWESIRSAVFALCDGLGPKDTNPRRRWPTVDVEGQDTLYVSAIQAAIFGVSGTQSVAVVDPPTDATPTNAKQIVELRYLLVTEAP